MADSGLQQSRWYFTKEQLEDSPSRRCGIDAEKELSNRQQAANLIQDMGQRLNVTQLCINTAIVYMHRFYVFHSFTKFHRNQIAPCALFLAAKVEEQPRKLEHVIKVAHRCLSRESTHLDPQSDLYKQQAARLVKNENIMLQTLGFEIGISHPHTFVVKCCTLVKASRDLAQTSYFMATNSLHLTTMCLKYRPTVVACACIHLACKWSSWEIPKSKEGKDWFLYVDEKVTLEELEQLTTEFLAILDKCPSRLRRRIMTGGIATGPSTADSPSSSHPAGASSTPITTFSSPMTASPKEEKHSFNLATSVPSIAHVQQHHHHVPSATVTSNQVPAIKVDSSEVKEEKQERHGSISSVVSTTVSDSIIHEQKQSPLHEAPQVKVERKELIPNLLPHTHSSHHHHQAASVPPLNSHGVPPQPPIKLKIPAKSANDNSSSHEYRERSDSHGSSKNHSSSHAGNNSSLKPNPSFKLKLKLGSETTEYKLIKDPDDDKRKEEERKKRRYEEVDRSSRRDTRDDKRSKERKHHR